MSIASNVIGSVKNWWWFVVKGLLLITAGVAVISRPLEGYVGLSLLFSLIILGAGISQVFFSISNRALLPGWGWTLVSGIIDLAVGLYLLAFPVVTMATLPYFVGFWLMFRAFYLMGIALDLHSYQVPAWGWLLTGGIVLLLVSMLILYYPVSGAVSIVACSALAFILAGILNILLAVKFRNIKSAVSNLL